MRSLFTKGAELWHLCAYHISALGILERGLGRGLEILVGLSGIHSANSDVSRYIMRDVVMSPPEDSSCLIGRKNAWIFWDGQLVPAPRPFSHYNGLKSRDCSLSPDLRYNLCRYISILIYIYLYLSIFIYLSIYL